MRAFTKCLTGVLLGSAVGLASPAAAQTVPSGFSATPVVAGPSYSDLHGIVVTADERLLIARGSGTVGNQELVEVDLVTGVSSSLISGLPLGHPDRMLIGNGGPLLGNDLILADHNSNEVAPCCDGRVFRIDLDTLAVTTVSAGNPLGGSVGDPFGVAQGLGGAFGTSLYVVDFQGASPVPPVIYEVLNDGTAVPLVVDEPQWSVNASPKDLAFDPSGAYSGDLFVADEGEDDTVWRVTPTGVVTSFADFPRPTAVAFGPGGPFGQTMYVLSHVGNTSTLYTVAPDGSVTEFATGFRSVTAATPDIAFSPDGQTLYVAIEDEVVAIHADPGFSRGDCNADGGFDIADPVSLLATLFSGGSPPTCDDACDTNDDGSLDISDAVFALSSLFSGGAPPAAPFPSCGADPTPDTLGCASFGGCAP